jgi:hypothetical protein
MVSIAYDNANSGGTTASFVYDPVGHRMSKTIGGNVTQLLYDSACLINRQRQALRGDRGS